MSHQVNVPFWMDFLDGLKILFGRGLDGCMWNQLAVQPARLQPVHRPFGSEGAGKLDHSCDTVSSSRKTEDRGATRYAALQRDVRAVGQLWKFERVELVEKYSRNYLSKLVESFRCHQLMSKNRNQYLSQIRSIDQRIPVKAALLRSSGFGRPISGLKQMDRDRKWTRKILRRNRIKPV